MALSNEVRGIVIEASPFSWDESLIGRVCMIKVQPENGSTVMVPYKSNGFYDAAIGDLIYIGWDYGRCIYGIIESNGGQVILVDSLPDVTQASVKDQMEW